MYDVEKHDYGHSIISYTLTLPDKYTTDRFISVTLDTDGSLMFPRMDSAVSLGPSEAIALKKFIDDYMEQK